jgi:hypothetical protein
MQNYLERQEVSKEAFDKNRLTESKLKKGSTVDITKVRSQRSESLPTLIENSEIEKEAIIDNGYENNSSHDSNHEIKKEVLTSNDASVSKEENTEEIMSCNALYVAYRNVNLPSSDCFSNEKCDQLNVNELKKNFNATKNNSIVTLVSLRNKAQKFLLLLILMSLFGIFKIYKRMDTINHYFHKLK